MTPMTVAHQAPLFMGFSRQENWSGLPFPLPRDLPDPGTEPVSPALAGGFFTTEPPGKALSDDSFALPFLPPPPPPPPLRVCGFALYLKGGPAS